MVAVAGSSIPFSSRPIGAAIGEVVTLVVFAEPSKENTGGTPALPGTRHDARNTWIEADFFDPSAREAVRRAASGDKPKGRFPSRDPGARALTTKTDAAGKEKQRERSRRRKGENFSKRDLKAGKRFARDGADARKLADQRRARYPPYVAFVKAATGRFQFRLILQGV